MAILTHIQSEQLYQKTLPNELAHFQDIRTESLPVFVRNYTPASLPFVGMSTNKSLIENISIESLSPAIMNVSLTNVEVQHPQEWQPLAVDYLNSPQEVGQYFGYDPDEWSIDLHYNGEATDLITNENFPVNTVLSLTEIAISY